MSNVHKPGRKGRKIGRNKDKCNAYSLEGRRTKNKIKRIRKSGGEKAVKLWIKENKKG